VAEEKTTSSLEGTLVQLKSPTTDPALHVAGGHLIMYDAASSLTGLVIHHQ